MAQRDRQQSMHHCLALGTGRAAAITIAARQSPPLTAATAGAYTVPTAATAASRAKVRLARGAASACTR